jgi:hypothetical protein
MSTHEYKGHAIRVEARPGAARPWGVWVDGVELFGQGDRVRRRLAYGTAAAALDAGKRHVRERLATAGKPPWGDAARGEPGSAAARLRERFMSDDLSPLRALEQESAVGPPPLPISPDAAKRPCFDCGHRRDAHSIPYETNLSLRCAVANCSCIEFTRPPVQPNLYPCGCSRHKVDAGRCDQYRPGEVP